jgi:exodeoxyribonuclease VII small subunit
MGQKMTFEAAMERLEDIVQQLENGRIGLDEAVKIFEEGMTLYRKCQVQLQDAEKKIETLVKTDDGFRLEALELEA